ncbi:MAG TPA: hypothetical protein VIL28_08655 [Steroidobacteraceae bacterium]
MKEIQPTASYVQNHELLSAMSAKQAALRALCSQHPATGYIWDLLATPQTVETLCRRLANEQERVPVSEIRDSLTKLMREDLIQISPDT